MANDQSGPLVVVLERGLEPPDIHRHGPWQLPPVLSYRPQRRPLVVHGGVAALHVHRPVASRVQRVQHRGRQHPLHEGVEPRRPHRHKDMCAPCRSRGRGLEKRRRVVGHGQSVGRQQQVTVRFEGSRRHARRLARFDRLSTAASSFGRPLCCVSVVRSRRPRPTPKQLRICTSAAPSRPALALSTSGDLI